MSGCAWKLAAGGPMDADRLQAQIEAAPALQRLHGKLQDALQFHAEGAAQLDPILIMMIISTLVQIVIYCRQTRNDADITDTIRELRTVPARKLVRVRRQLRQTWHEYCQQRDLPIARNPILPAIYELSEELDDGDIAEFLKLAATE